MAYQLLDNVHADLAPARVDGGPADEGREIMLRVTRFCNQKCLFCLVELDAGSYAPYEEVLREVDRAEAQHRGSQLRFVLTGGEPSLHPRFHDLVSALLSRGHYVCLQTNGVTFASKANLARVEAFLPRVEIFASFHSHLPKAYDAITGTRGQFPAAVAGLHALLSAAGGGTLNIVMNALNVGAFSGWAEFVGRTFAAAADVRANVSVMTNVERYPYASKLLVRLSDVAEAVRAAAPVFARHPRLRLGDSFGGPCDLPFCVAKGLPNFRDDALRVAPGDGLSDRVKLPGCASCRYDRSCAGALKLYLERFGGDEFVPVA